MGKAKSKITKALAITASDSLRNTFQSAIKKRKNLRCTYATNALEGLNKASSADFSLLIIDTDLPDLPGATLLRALLDLKGSEPVTLIWIAKENLTLADEDRARLIELCQIDSAEFAESILEQALDQSIKALTVKSLESKDLKSTASDRRKSVALVRLAQELRSPLTAIMGYAEGLQDPKVGRESLDQGLNDIIHSSNYVIQMIDDIITAAAIEDGSFSVKSEKFPLVPLLTALEVELKQRAKSKTIEFSTSYLTKVPEYIESDSSGIESMLRGLLDNAIKFTHEGSVTLTISYDQVKNLIKFSVSDTGQGMTAETVQSLQQALLQSNPGSSLLDRGECLGLCVVNHTASMLGGALQIESAQGLGSTFLLSVGAGQCRGAVLAAKTGAPAKLVNKSDTVSPEQLSGKILIAEDNFDTQRVFTFMLKNTNATFCFANNGQQAVEKALQENYDLILMDLMMPIMNGVEATKSLRQLGITTPIVAVTAAGSASSKQECFDAGMNDYLEKPVALQEMFRLLSQFLPLLPSQPIENASCLPTTVVKSASPQPTVLQSYDSNYPTDSELGGVVTEFVSGLAERLAELEQCLNNKRWKELRAIANELAGTAAMCGFKDLGEELLKLEVIGGSGESNEIQKVLAVVQNLAQPHISTVKKVPANTPTPEHKKQVARLEKTSSRVIQSEFAEGCQELIPLILEFLESVDSKVSDLSKLAQEKQWEQLEASSHEISGTAAFCGFGEFSDRARELELLAADPKSGNCETILDNLKEVTSAMIVGKDFYSN